MCVAVTIQFIDICQRDRLETFPTYRITGAAVRMTQQVNSSIQLICMDGAICLTLTELNWLAQNLLYMHELSTEVLSILLYILTKPFIRTICSVLFPHCIPGNQDRTPHVIKCQGKLSLYHFQIS